MQIKVMMILVFGMHDLYFSNTIMEELEGVIKIFIKHVVIV